ncbi:MAG: peptidase M64 [Bacteroidetes bacterium 4484_249]|nr:MAG: peptidase M64 [Bacteroidetes bacterium 4484_249]
MKRFIITILLLSSISAFANFDDFFYNKTLRIDYMHSGDFQNEYYFLDEVKVEPYWGGSQINLIDTFKYGKYFFELYDLEKDSIIYSRGYSTLFGEWQTTDEAKATKRSFTETIIMPLPKNNAKIIFYSRNRKGVFEEVFSYLYKNDNYFISPERRLERPVFDVKISGDPENKIDIIILPEGYSEAEMGTFIRDCENFRDVLFSFKPYSDYKESFNIRGVLASSAESGSDIPADTIWKKTLINTSFYTFDSERYCMTYDNKSVRDLAANAPYDQIYILVNSNKYGGGAIYNYYSISVNSNLHAAKIFVHEFGHGFAGLGDEYYNSEVAYSEFYPLDVEPWEPNLTTLIDFDKKWKHLLKKRTPIPTPSEKKYLNKTGVFEGGGYAAKGVYRPAYDCLMNSFKGDEFCEACNEAIVKMILFYSEE